MRTEGSFTGPVKVGVAKLRYNAPFLHKKEAIQAFPNVTEKSQMAC